MIRICFLTLLMAFVPSTSFAQDAGRRPESPPEEPRTHASVKRSPCPPSVARQDPQRCLPVGKKLTRAPAKAQVVLTHGRPAHHRTAQVSHRRVSSGYRTTYASPSHMAAQRAMLAPPPPVRDMSGYRTTVYVAPAGTPYPLTEPKPGDYLCTTTPVPLDTKVVGMHSPKPHPPCGYKWAWDGGSGKGYWWLKPDPNYGVRR